MRIRCAAKALSVISSDRLSHFHRESLPDEVGRNSGRSHAMTYCLPKRRNERQIFIGLAHPDTVHTKSELSGARICPAGSRPCFIFSTVRKTLPVVLECPH